MFCDKDAQWCKMRENKKLGIPFTNKPGLPIAIRDYIMPIFQDLSTPQLLEKCFHGKTQNCNESLNGFIWKRLPKDIFMGSNVLIMGVYSAVLAFNSGISAMLRIYQKFEMKSGFYTREFRVKKDGKRIEKMGKKMSVEDKSNRKRKRAIKKGFQVINENTEVEVYASGKL